MEEDVSVDERTRSLIQKKLARPELELSTDESIEVLTGCIDLGALELAGVQKGAALAIFGNTGAGKSTLMNCLHGCKMESVRAKDLGLKGGGKVVRVAEGSQRNELFRIGHANVSQTFIPGFAGSDALGDQVTLVDCPGFFDNRGPEINVANAVNIKQALSHFKEMRVVVLINYNSIKADRGRGVRDLIKIMRELFGDTERLLASMESVVVGVSRTPLKDDDDDFILCDDVLEQL